MTVDILAEIIENLIPHFTQNTLSYDWGAQITISFGTESRQYVSHASAGGDLGELVRKIEENALKYLELNFAYKALEVEQIQTDLTMEWLYLKTQKPTVFWGKLFELIAGLEKRTYENEAVGINLILCAGHGDIRLDQIVDDAKVLDVIGDSRYTYIAINDDLELVDYGCYTWDSVQSKTSYNSVPDFLRPYTSNLQDAEIGVTLTHTKDLLIYGANGLLATKRKGNWTIYENPMLKNLFKMILVDGAKTREAYWLACNLFDLSWDLSYRRHGALIVVGDGELEDFVNNPESIIENRSTELRQAFYNKLCNINLGQDRISDRAIILELASVDGAVIFGKSDAQLKSFGSIIKTAGGVNAAGARTVAAYSAAKYGLAALKISSDGDILLLKQVKDKKGKDLILKFKFM